MTHVASVGSTKEHNQQDIKAARYVSSTNTDVMLRVVNGSFSLFVLDERGTIVPDGQDVSTGALTRFLLSRWEGSAKLWPAKPKAYPLWSSKLDDAIDILA